MAHGILFGSGNRLLGSSIGDLSLYGGQSDPAVAIRAADPADGLAPALPHPAVADAIRTGGDHHGEAPSIGAVPAEPGIAQEQSGVAPAAFLAGAPAVALHALDASQAIATPPGIALFGTGPIGAQPLLSQPHDSDTLLATTEHAGDGAVPFSAPAGEMLTPLAETAHDTIDTLAGTVSGIAAPATGILSPLLDTAHDALTTTLGAAGDTLHGLSGSDPLGGVATLVSLVSVTDMFDLHPVDASPVDLTADTGLDVLDTLVGDAGLADPLLGVAHGGDHGLGLDHGLHLDHPLGL